MPPTSQKQILKQSKTLLNSQVHEQTVGESKSDRPRPKLNFVIAKYLPATLN